MRHPTTLLLTCITAAIVLAACAAPDERQEPAEAAGGTVARDYEELESRVFDVSTELEAQLLLFEQLGTDAMDANATVAGGTVTLTGRVSDTAALADAEAAMLELPGIEQVDNRIQVVPGEGADMDDVQKELADRTLKAKVKRSLIEALGNAALDLEVDAGDGTVTLRGTLPSEAQHQQALVAAETTEGTQVVEDLIEVTE